MNGAISVFGPGRGARRQGPFVVAVLIAARDADGPLEPIEAYAHPCWRGNDFLPLDSSHERRCLDMLTAFQREMEPQGLKVTVRKPLYDMSERYLGDGGEEDMVVKPDFEGTVHTLDDTFVRSFAVEVMGLDTESYRERKARLRAILVASRTHYLEHVAHDDAQAARTANDDRFRHALEKLGRVAHSAAARR